MSDVLVVEDQSDAREMLSHYLELCGYSVQRACDGMEAIDVARRDHPNVILMDLMMPRMDGWEATRQLKSDDRTKSIPVVAVSACARVEDRTRAAEVGFDAFIPKPIDLDAVATAVHRAVASDSRPTKPHPYRGA